MVYNGHREISLVVAGRKAPKKSLVLACRPTGHLHMTSTVGGEGVTQKKKVAFHHFQKSRHGLKKISKKSRLPKVAVIRWPL